MKVKQILPLCLMPLAGAGVGCGASEERGYAPPPGELQTQSALRSSSHSKEFNASLTTAGRHPVVGKPWRWSVKVATKGGRPLAAKTKTQFLLGGRVVGRGGRRSFMGSSSSVVRWPDRSVGFPLTFRVVVATPKGTAKLDYAIQVRKP